MNIDNFKKICIVGWAKTGISLCNLLLSLKKKVKVSEIREMSCFSSSLVDEFWKKGVKFEFGGHSHNFLKDSHLVILSPGVDIINSSAVESAEQLGIPYVGEIEFAFWLTQAKIIAITGTNGKTTTAYLTYEVLKQKKSGLFLGGNIGTPFSSFVLNTKRTDLIVLEISSFQLETILKLQPYVAVLLNLEPDHLDRHLNLKNYLSAKTNIFKNQQSRDWAVLNKNIDFPDNFKETIKSRIVYYSKEFSNDNFSCVYRIATIFGLNKTDCRNIFSKFCGLPHRLQYVKRINGVTFINDSKATNPHSTIWALKNVKGKVILLAGGRDKQLNYSLIDQHLKRIKKINLFGEAASKIKNSLNFNVRLEVFSCLEDAVLSSYKQAKSGDTILLSPMCASFDEFYSYEERGNKFMEIVKRIEADKC